LSALEIVTRPLLPGTQSYIALHESLTQGSSPFIEIAIELEIETLSLRFGGDFIKHSTAILGQELFEGLNCIRHHVARDESHTRFNERQLQKLLYKPGYLPDLIMGGRRALECYLASVSYCLDGSATD
jgi:hypothetical protein